MTFDLRTSTYGFGRSPEVSLTIDLLYTFTHHYSQPSLEISLSNNPRRHGDLFTCSPVQLYINLPFQYLTCQPYFYLSSINIRKQISYVNCLCRNRQTKIMVKRKDNHSSVRELPLSVSFLLLLSSLILAISLFMKIQI